MVRNRESHGKNWASCVALRVKHLPAMWETWVRSLGQEDPLEKKMAAHSSTLAWKIHGQRSLVGHSPCCKEWDMTECLKTYGLKANAFKSVLMGWMNLEPIIQSEVRKRKINITC